MGSGGGPLSGGCKQKGQERCWESARAPQALMGASLSPGKSLGKERRPMKTGLHDVPAHCPQLAWPHTPHPAQPPAGTRGVARVPGVPCKPSSDTESLSQAEPGARPPELAQVPLLFVPTAAPAPLPRRVSSAGFSEAQPELGALG